MRKKKVMKEKCVFLFVLLSSLLALPGYGSVKDHLKATEGKQSHSRMKNIDFIYMINLDQRPEKFAKASAALNPYGIYPHRFSAVNGWELSLEALSDLGLKYKEGMPSIMSSWFPLNGNGKIAHGPLEESPVGCFSHCISRGAIGICLSHISILQDAWDAGYETIWVMEDDVVCNGDPRSLSKLIKALDKSVGKDNWDVFFTDRDTRGKDGVSVPAYGSAARPDMDCSFEGRYRKEFTEREDIDSNFSRISSRFGAYSMVIRRSGIKKLLEFAKSHDLYLPYDMDNYLELSLNRYSLRYDFITNDLEALTDNGKKNYLED
jgi:GR25 family glycosyltransferase involved in LPS biosynthesis